MFPTLFAATAMGLCNFFARVATIFAPLVAEIPGRTAMCAFTVMSTVACILSLKL